MFGLILPVALTPACFLEGQFRSLLQMTGYMTEIVIVNRNFIASKLRDWSRVWRCFGWFSGCEKNVKKRLVTLGKGMFQIR